MGQLIGVVIGGFIALGGGALTAWLQARHQRKATRSKDLWDRRAALYLDLLLHLDGSMSFATDPHVPGYYGPRSPEQFQRQKELTARISLFGSPTVRELWEAATEAAADFSVCVVEGGFVDRDGRLPSAEVTDPNYLRFEAAKQRTEREFIQRLRHEIDVDEHLKG
ncbi:hypothetical protein OG444_39845 (plasmid) [Streptomyces sp. NBC_01232]|uniref:hypothetical protein n=1 Tax=Streptomyces sp. NBC_01232 TaxID=2903786 RepID=UPI002E14FD1F|nr:hypothetical protein OG444_39845 [Streptomyces sp. NBC_01232]